MNSVFLVDESNEHAISAMMKIAKASKPGAMIPLTHKEFEAIKYGHFLLQLPMVR